MGRKYQERRIYSQGQAEVRTAVERAVYELGLEVKPGSSEWEIQGSRSMSTFSWGEQIKVLMATSPGGGTQVLAESKLVFGFVDWGRNQKNVEQLLESMAALVGPGEVAPIEP
ncbi:MAG: hypothetical protein ACR2QK_05135 [Acidimicrobiales bacterium]